ncbi:F-actin-capping protein subunit alpha [Limtongia smithiae]|uniref:F-actin-capping protein subunit alpha n=1 Tax=Limtongia smithiae TaxID=1125753 RepID=UPI0034D01C0E
MSVSAKIKAASTFLSDAPPGEVKDVFDDISAIVDGDDAVLAGLDAAFEKYNIAQFVTVTLPSVDKHIVLSEYNSLGDGKFFDSEVEKEFTVNHKTLKTSAIGDYAGSSGSVSKVTADVKHYVSEHYPAPSSYGVYPQSSVDEVAIVIVGNKYSPTNFWNGRWRSSYVANLSSGTLIGTMCVDVHYYEDGNVRLNASKKVSVDFSGDAVKAIAQAERSFQEEVNMQFNGLSDGAFKSLRRQLPVTRSKIEWGKSIGAYRLGQDIGGGRSK